MSSATLTPLESVLEPLGRCLTPDVARKLLEVLPDLASQTRVAELAVKSDEGTLTPGEREEYLAYVEAIDLASLIRAIARRTLGTQP